MKSDFAHQLEKLIYLSGLTMTQFSEACGISRGVLTDILNGRHGLLGPKNMKKVAKLFRVSRSYLVTGVPSTPWERHIDIIYEMTEDWRFKWKNEIDI